MKTLIHGFVLWAVFCWSFVQNTVAAPVSEQQASNAVLRLATVHYPATSATPQHFSTPFGLAQRSVREVYTLIHGSNMVGYVVRLNPSGYYLVSSDDQLPPWKLRADKGDFTNLPPSLITVLKLEMAEDRQALNDLQKVGKTTVTKYYTQWQTLLSTSSPTNGEPAPPTGSPGVYLLATTWDQDDPYNYYCPAASGGPGGRAYAGCTACAVAQILRYRSWPVAVTKDFTYTDTNGACTGTHSISDAGLGPYNWANMPNAINDSSPIVQQQAIGQLMYHAAVALESDFEANETSAYPTLVPFVLQSYFDYTCGIYEIKSNYTSSQWYNTIAADIDANRPIFYAMWQADGSDGHAVVCDGYQNGHEIHLNWGWSGSWNAWYNIDSVSASGYTWTIHGAVFGIAPLFSESLTWVWPGSIGYGIPLGSAQLDATASVPGVFAYNPAAGTVLNAGTNTLAAVFTPSDTLDYTIANISVSIVVLRAPLTVTANNASRLYGSANPVLSGSITGIQNGDNITATFTTSATASSPVGTYPIVPSLVDPQNRLGNYTVTINHGTLTVNSAVIAPPDGMVDWWPAEGNANDFVGPNNGTPVGGLSYGPGEVGLAFQFDGWSSYINVGASNIPPPWTASFWVNRQDAPGTSAALLASPVVSTNGCALKLEQYDGTRNVGFTQYGVADYEFDYSAPTGTWVHLVFVGTATNTSLYANGVFEGSIAVSISLPRTYIGQGFSSSGVPIDRACGSVDEVSLFNRALSVSEINALYSAGKAGQYVGPALPTVAVTPATLTAAYGWTATFNANATGVPPLSYQWLFNGTNLLGATTESLAITNAQADDRGSYQAIVSNAYGSATSTMATLTVLALPSIVQYEFQADIDGRDWLVIQRQTVQWQHFDFMPVGLDNTNYPATIISSSFNGSTLMSSASWIPTWPNGTGFGAWSSTYGELVPVLPMNPTAVNLNVVSGRGSVTIVQLPTAANTNTLIVEFNDDAISGDALYDVQINVGTTAPTLQALTLGRYNGTFSFGWGAVPGQAYQVQYKTNLTQPTWLNLGNPITATNVTVTTSDTSSDFQRFYRVMLQP